MKRHLVIMVVLLFIVAMLPVTFVAADDFTLDTQTGALNEPIDFSMGVSDDYFPFVYDSNDAWLVDYLGETDCVDGNFYVLNKLENEINLLSTERVKIFSRNT